ncbi:unnamed protein product [Caenorhabditis bovis]|uniref:Nematode cuticle collagen N-terminal domain-containing protein n=1 Tax=Caenorhabditis bovis TaxID=2654633 RepID=A0A8S1ECX8_9PELO|nr:unnamed protein product [Caenorhabditis bovis]
MPSTISSRIRTLKWIIRISAIIAFIAISTIFTAFPFLYAYVYEAKAQIAIGVRECKTTAQKIYYETNTIEYFQRRYRHY